jgi:hypothetical protein
MLPGGVIPAAMGGVRDPNRLKVCLFTPGEDWELQGHVLLISCSRALSGC